jgi:hypothetical protein
MNRVDADEELTAEEAVTPPLDALFTYLRQRPRQDLPDAPRRVWRVKGWRGSGRLMEEIAAAVREGRVDSEHAAIRFRRGGPPTGGRGGD